MIDCKPNTQHFGFGFGLANSFFKSKNENENENETYFANDVNGRR